MEKNNKVLIRLMDINDENNILSSFYTEKPSEFLKMYYFCQENDIPLLYKKNNTDDYLKEIEGTIKEIEVHFGGNGYLPCINVWIKKW